MSQWWNKIDINYIQFKINQKILRKSWPKNIFLSFSVHHQNFVIISFPVIVLFNLFRAVLYQLYLILRAFYNATSRIFNRPLLRKECLEICVVDKDKESRVEVVDSQETPLLLDCHGVETSVEINGKMASAGDPLLAKQKHHHRKAFEYISTALRLDEENKGNFLNNYYWKNNLAKGQI